MYLNFSQGRWIYKLDEKTISQLIFLYDLWYMLDEMGVEDKESIIDGKININP
jgi:hypothetical protein